MQDKNLFLQDNVFLGLKGPLTVLMEALEES